MGRAFFVFAGLVLASAGVFLLLYVLWLLWKRDEGEMATPAIEIGPDPEPEAEPAPVSTKAEEIELPVQVVEEEAEEETEPPAPDDLKVIEGIGPKIAGVLQAAGITTYARLADCSVADIQQILEAEDPRLLRLAKPDHWPEQAALAAGGEWDALGALQGELKAGRKK
jgi:predicted flap endonuclease-1-like 5' DNA nuclease